MSKTLHTQTDGICGRDGKCWHFQWFKRNASETTCWQKAKYTPRINREKHQDSIHTIVLFREKQTLRRSKILNLRDFVAFLLLMETSKVLSLHHPTRCYKWRTRFSYSQATVQTHQETVPGSVLLNCLIWHSETWWNDLHVKQSVPKATLGPLSFRLELWAGHSEDGRVWGAFISVLMPHLSFGLISLLG